jgi:hypothetical protein
LNEGLGSTERGGRRVIGPDCATVPENQPLENVRVETGHEREKGLWLAGLCTLTPWLSGAQLGY